MRSHTLMVIAGLVVLLGAAACSEGPTVIEDHADRVKLRWYNWDADLHDAAQVADARCAPRGRHAVLEQETLDADVSLAEFMCR